MFDFLTNEPKHQVDISRHSILFAFGIALLLWVLYIIHPILIALFLSFIIAVALNPLVNRVQRKIKNRSTSIILVYIFVISLVILLLVSLLPPLVSQLYALLKTINLPIFQEELTQIQLSLAMISELFSKYGNSVNAIFSILNYVFSSVFNIFTIFVMSFYLTQELPVLHLKLYWLTKDAKKIQAGKDFIQSLIVQLGGWVRGELILMTTIGVVTLIGLTLFGVPYALPLGILAGLLEILPNLGPTISAIPAIIIAFFQINPTMGFVVFIFYIIVQQVENNFLVPKIMKVNADINPLVAIVSILIGFRLYSVLGALLAIPTYLILRTIYGMILKKRLRGEE